MILVGKRTRYYGKFSLLSSFTIVNVSHNQLTDLSALDSCLHLLAVNASKNAITVGPTFQQEHLQVVKLQGNQMITLEELEGPGITNLYMSRTL